MTMYFLRTVDRFWFISWIVGLALFSSLGIWAYVAAPEPSLGIGIFILTGVVAFGGLALIKQEYT